MKLMLLAATAAIALSATPASARVLQFTITNVGGTDRGDFRFTLDEDRVPDIVLQDSVRYGAGTPGNSPRLTITYTDVPGAGSGTAMSGVTFFTSRQQGGLTFSAAPFGAFRLINTTLINNMAFNPALAKAQNKALFKLGTFAISTTPQNSGPRPFDNYRITIAAVPEPATWAMMIAGFGMVGAAMRRSSGKTVTA